MGNVLWQELEGDEPMQPRVLSLIHNTHPAATELIHDAVVRDGLADHAQACYCGSLGKSMKATEMKATELAVFQQGQINKVPAFLDRARWR
jgi:hypothetical protein